MTGWTGWAVGATLLCLCAGLGCVALGVARVGDRTSQLTHAVMGVAMAGMLSPWGTRARAERPSARRSGTPQAVVGRVRVEPAAHGVMSALMAAMFLGAV